VKHGKYPAPFLLLRRKCQLKIPHTSLALLTSNVSLSDNAPAYYAGIFGGFPLFAPHTSLPHLDCSRLSYLPPSTAPGICSDTDPHKDLKNVQFLAIYHFLSTLRIKGQACHRSPVKTLLSFPPDLHLPPHGQTKIWLPKFGYHHDSSLPRAFILIFCSFFLTCVLTFSCPDVHKTFVDADPNFGIPRRRFPYNPPNPQGPPLPPPALCGQ